MTRRKTNLTYQAEQAIKEINYIAESKRERRQSNEHGIHSYKQMKETISVVMNFVKWLKTEKVKSIYNLTEREYKGYIQFKHDSDVLNGHLMNIETGLRHLEKGMAKVSEKLGRKPVKWTPEKRIISFKAREEPKDRSYTKDEIEAIISHCSHKVGIGITLSWKIGLRAKEVINLRVEHVDLEREELIFTEKTAKGVTKGGRYRLIPIPSDFVNVLTSIVTNKGIEELVLGLTNESTLRDGLSRACKKAGIKSRGIHGFRHTYARNRLNDLLNEKGISEVGGKMMKRIFNNIAKGKKADYGIYTDKDRQIFHQVKQCIDIVHGELGHGKDRWDLAKVYMK